MTGPVQRRLPTGRAREAPGWTLPWVLAGVVVIFLVADFQEMRSEHRRRMTEIEHRTRELESSMAEMEAELGVGLADFKRSASSLTREMRAWLQGRNIKNENPSP